MYSIYSVVIVLDRPECYTKSYSTCVCSNNSSEHTTMVWSLHTISYSLIFDISPYSNNLGMRTLVSSNSNHNGVVFRILIPCPFYELVLINRSWHISTTPRTTIFFTIFKLIQQSNTVVLS